MVSTVDALGLKVDIFVVVVLKVVQMRRPAIS
jgi:hypothetical protein